MHATCYMYDVMCSPRSGAAQLPGRQQGTPGRATDPLKPKIFPSRGGRRPLPQAQPRARPPRSGGPSATQKTPKVHQPVGWPRGSPLA